EDRASVGAALSEHAAPVRGASDEHAATGARVETERRSLRVAGLELVFDLPARSRADAEDLEVGGCVVGSRRNKLARTILCEQTGIGFIADEEVGCPERLPLDEPGACKHPVTRILDRVSDRRTIRSPPSTGGGVADAGEHVLGIDRWRDLAPAPDR